MARATVGTLATLALVPSLVSQCCDHSEQATNYDQDTEVASLSGGPGDGRGDRSGFPGGVASRSVPYEDLNPFQAAFLVLTSESLIAQQYLLKICEAKQMNATAAVVEGDAKEAICQAMELMQAGLLILGSRGLVKIKRAFLGSMSDYLKHHSFCPVLVVKPPKAQAK